MRNAVLFTAGFIILFGCLTVFQGSIFGEVPQDIGFPDILYQDLLEPDCRECHGLIQYERHHLSATGQSGDCLACHSESGGYLITETDCLVCHEQLGDLSPHHETQEAFDGFCAECHQANLVTDIQEVPPGDPPPYPELHTCSSCHDIPSNSYTHHNSAELFCTQCHDPHNMWSFKGCKACHSELSLHNIPPHREACDQCHGGESPPPVPAEPVMPAIHFIEPVATKGGETLGIAGADFGDFGPDSHVDFDIVEAIVDLWEDSTIHVEVPDIETGNYDIHVFNYLGVSNKVGFSLSPDARDNPIFGQLDCATCHAEVHGFQSPDYIACVSCHVLHEDPAEFHDMTRLPDESCAECHDANVEIEHTENMGIGCEVCHESEDPIIQEAIEKGIGGEEVFCGDCHLDAGDHFCAHEVENNDCTSCHQRNLQPEHDDDCAVCHESSDPVVIQAIDDGNTTCTACHDVEVHTMRCGICHDDKEWDDYIGEEQEIHEEHMKKLTCGICHVVPTEPELEPSGQYCTICHEAEPYDPEKVREAHKRHVKKTKAVPYQCMTCHGRSIPDHESTECELCHDDKTYPEDWSLNKHRKHAKKFECTACHQHPRDFDFEIDSACQRCHNDRNYGDLFRLHKRHRGKNQCWACHGSYDIAQHTAGFQCINCHGEDPEEEDIPEIHEEHTEGVYQCWVCHDALVPVYSLDQVNEPEDCQ